MMTFRRSRETPSGSREDARRSTTQASTDSVVGAVGYLCLCLNVLLLGSVLAADPSTFETLSREDYWVENLTAVWFLLAGGLLFVTASVDPTFHRWLYILGGMAMVFVAGEEISWGQRIFTFATPDFLMQLNDQGEFTVHNLANYMPDFIYLNSTLILCMTTSAAFFCRRDRLFGIPLPSIPLMLVFLIVLSFDSGVGVKELSGDSVREYATAIKRSFGVIAFEEKGLLLLFFIFTLLSRQSKLAVASAATLTVVLALTYVNYNSDVEIGSLLEVREYLTGICCLFYCLELLLAQARLTAISRTLSGPKLPRGRIPFLMNACYLVIAGSVGLTCWGYYNAMARAGANEEAYRSVTAREPAVRTVFDVWLIGNDLIYIKEPCAPADTEPGFWLHVIPEDVNDLPGDRKQYGFDNLDFDYEDFAARSLGALDGRCVVRRPLPDYPIVHIGTGQTWNVVIPVGAVEQKQDR